MGMDIYLKNKEAEKRRDEAKEQFYYWARKRDEEKDENEKAELQKEVDKWYGLMNSAENGYFRVNYNDYSLSYWLMYNIDKRAKGDWGIEPFYSAVKGKKKPVIRSKKFRKELLETVKSWYEKAQQFKDKESYLMVIDREKSDSSKRKWVKNKVILKPDETNGYIEWLKELVDFAELAVRTGSPIYVSA